MMNILVATDAWHPQINGVVRTLSAVTEAARPFGASLRFITPDRFPTMPLPGYAEIRLGLAYAQRVEALIAQAQPDAIHIATEGPVGLAVRRYCIRRGFRSRRASTPAFLNISAARFAVPERWTWAWLRRFHAAGRGDIRRDAGARRRTDAARLPQRRAVAARRRHRTSSVRAPGADLGLPRPIFLSVGRVAVEKNLEAFLALDLPGSRSSSATGPDARGAGARISERGVPGQPDRRGAGRDLCRGRRLRFSEPDRHLRPRPAGSAGERPAGRRRSRYRARSTSSRMRRSACSMMICKRRA